jgi:hypothetical protein
MRARLTLLLAIGVACSPTERGGEVVAEPRIARSIAFMPDSLGRCFPCAMEIDTDSGPLRVDSTAGVGLILQSAAGAQVAYSAIDGAGGYENEGQSLWIVDVATKQRRAVMREYTQVREISELRLPDGHGLLVVRLEDGGAGMSHIAMVDPLRGQVARMPRSLVAKVDGDTIELHAWDGEAPWTEPGARDTLTGLLKAPPARITRLSISELVARPVMENPRSPQ